MFDEKNDFSIAMLDFSWLHWDDGSLQAKEEVFESSTAVSLK